jgi:hypothetical protein
LFSGRRHRRSDLPIAHKRIAESTGHHRYCHSDHPPLTLIPWFLQCFPWNPLVDFIAFLIHLVNVWTDRRGFKGVVFGKVEWELLRAIPGNSAREAIVFLEMAVNPDPKPGRWILPLVILGMVAFTFFFIKELPEASPDSTIASNTTTTAPVEGETTTTAPGPDTGGDPAVDAYLLELDEINTALQLLRTEMVTVNDGFDADPREIEFPEAESRMITIDTDTQALADRVAAMTVPPGFETNQQALTSAIDSAAAAASEALEGLQGSDPGEIRRAAVVAYTTAADNFDTEVANTRTAAGVPSDG